MNCTAIGKMLLAYAPDTELELLAEKGAFAQPTPHSLADSMALKLELARIRETGVAFDHEEFLPGAMCIAAAVRNYDGKVIAAVNVSGPVQRMKMTETHLIQSVLNTAKAISASLGNREENNGR
jgi:DNA-binding IclR family transcriptional regulator